MFGLCGRSRTVLLLGLMRNLCIITAGLALVAAGCSSRQISNSSDMDVPVLSRQAGHTLVPSSAFSQLSVGRLSIKGQAKHRVFSISDGLPDVRMVSKNPIVAATDQDGWFFFATSVARDEATDQPVEFISGYAIRHGSQQIVYWSTW
jgi:hypothetical protein